MSTSAYSQALLSVTQAKLNSLCQQRIRLSAHFNPVLDAIQNAKEMSLSQQVALLVEAIQKCPVTDLFGALPLKDIEGLTF